jgi:hypothetical protein
MQAPTILRAAVQLLAWLNEEDLLARGLEERVDELIEGAGGLSFVNER